MAAGGVPQFASLYVGDLHPDVTEAMLYEIFNSVGPVASIRVCRDSVTRRSLGYGYVNFHSVSDAERALDTLNYSSVKGRSCRIMWSQRDPSLRKSGAGNIYVKNLDRNVDNKALYDTFSLFGNILSCKVAADAVGKSYGYGFVHYETEEAAKQAIERVNGMQIGEKTVQVFEFVKRGDRQGPQYDNYTNLYIKNFPDEWDEEKVKLEFGAFGNITSMAVREDNKGRKFAFVNFESNEEAKKCVETMHMKDMRGPGEEPEEGREEELGPDGHPVGKLYVQRAQSKAERQAELREKCSSTREPKQQGVNLYVKNLDESTGEAALRALFESFGTITSVAAPTDDKGKCKGFGFVCFASPDEATKAVTEMHLKVIRGKPLYVGLAERREARQERLRQRYSPSGGGGMPGMFGSPKGSGKGGKDGGKDGGKGGGKGAAMPQMYGGSAGGMPPMGMVGKGAPPLMGMMPPAMMGMMHPQQAAAMYGPRAMMGPRGPMMGAPQMMGMMGKGCPGMMPGKGGPGMMGMPGMAPMVGPTGPMGMMRPPMQQTPAGGRPSMTGGLPTAQPPQGGQPPAMGGPGAPLNAATLAAAPPTVQKQMIGEKLFPAIAKFQPEIAGKITGMMLEMDNCELLLLLESEQQLKNKVEEAMRVLETAKPA
uniref:Polyadenylate-binding protein n=1 Tax=Alexandrium monilatum TaxID=311494 RepID=A0A7S4SI77_9DINO